MKFFKVPKRWIENEKYTHVSITGINDYLEAAVWSYQNGTDGIVPLSVWLKVSVGLRKSANAEEREQVFDDARPALNELHKAGLIERLDKDTIKIVHFDEERDVFEQRAKEREDRAARTRACRARKKATKAS